MGFADTIRRHKAKAMGAAAEIIRQTVLEFGDELVTDWTPLGNPELWKSPPPADYRPGNLQSSWFFSIGAPSAAKTDRTDIREINGLGELAEVGAGQTLYLANSADHAGAIEGGHSTQAPVGIMWAAGEFPSIAYSVARRIAR